MKIINLFTLIVCCFCTHAYTCRQAPDYIIYENDKYYFSSEPIEYFFSEHPDKRPKVTSTGLYRGYIATYEIVDNKLMLNEMVVPNYKRYPREHDSIKNELFGEGDSFFLEGYSDISVIAIENHQITNIGSTLLEGRYTLLEIKNGLVTDKRQFDIDGFSKFREKQFAAFKQTEGYKTEYARLKHKDWSDAKVDDFILENIMSYMHEFMDDTL